MLSPGSQPTQGWSVKRVAWLPWVVSLADMMVVALLIAAGDWFDQTSRLTRVVSLGGHCKLVLAMAILGFVMLAGLAPLARVLSAPDKLELVLITMAYMVSVAALAGPLAILLLAVAAVLLILLPLVIVLFLILLLRGRR